MKMPTVSEKEAWMNIVEPADLDEHMRNIEQAGTTAEITALLFKKVPLKDGSKLLVHGCGTCQMFDYVTPADLGKVSLTFADVSPKMLEAAKPRLDQYKYLANRPSQEYAHTRIR